MEMVGCVVDGGKILEGVSRPKASKDGQKMTEKGKDVITLDEWRKHRKV